MASSSRACSAACTTRPRPSTTNGSVLLQFMARFGPSPADVSAVESWLGAGGLHATLSRLHGRGLGPGRPGRHGLGTRSSGTGHAAGTSRATWLSRHRWCPPRWRAARCKGFSGSTPSPSSNRRIRWHRHLSGRPGPSSQPNVDGLTPCAAAKAAAAPGYYTLDALGAAYGVGSLLTDHQNGQGQTIGLYEFGSPLGERRRHLRELLRAHQSRSRPCGRRRRRTTGGNGTVEADVDIEQVATQAPGASIISYEGPNTVSRAPSTRGTPSSRPTPPRSSRPVGGCASRCPGPPDSSRRSRPSSKRPPYRDRPSSPPRATPAPRTASRATRRRLSRSTTRRRIRTSPPWAARRCSVRATK